MNHRDLNFKFLNELFIDKYETLPGSDTTLSVQQGKCA